MNPRMHMVSTLAAGVVATVIGISPGMAGPVGIAVGSIGGNTQVGLPTGNSLGSGTIEFFIPLAGNDGVYGTFPSSCTFGRGTCSDTGRQPTAANVPKV